MMDNARTADQAPAPDQPTKPVGYREAMSRSLNEKNSEKPKAPGVDGIGRQTLRIPTQEPVSDL